MKKSLLNGQWIFKLYCKTFNQCPSWSCFRCHILNMRIEFSLSWNKIPKSFTLSIFITPIEYLNSNLNSPQWCVHFERQYNQDLNAARASLFENSYNTQTWLMSLQLNTFSHVLDLWTNVSTDYHYFIQRSKVESHLQNLIFLGFYNKTWINDVTVENVSFWLLFNFIFHFYHRNVYRQ